MPLLARFASCTFDAHGTTYTDEDHSGEPDDKDEGWILAGNNDGTSKDVLSVDWLGEAIREVIIESLLY